MGRTLFNINGEPADDLTEISTGELRTYRIAYAKAVRDVISTLCQDNPALNSDYTNEIRKKVIRENPLNQKCGYELTERDDYIPF